MNVIRIFAVISLFALLTGCGADLPEGVEIAMAKVPEVVDYNIHVRPIFSDRCYACHGPDAGNIKGGLQLHSPEAAYRESVEHPGTYPIVPGKLASSEVFHRLVSDDPDIIMPPPESNLKLSDYERAVLIKWIDQGAEYKDHWAFIKPAMPEVPAVKNEAFVANDIDNFVAKRLEREGLETNAPADKSLLLRRVTFDLTGLPPTPKEIDAFLADDSEDAYEKVVDRLLASPRYGEHMAVDWLDLARYADTHGYTVDRYRDMSPWRDWVIKSYNENLPYNDFVTWQLAGDLLPDPTREQILATGFNRNHQQNMEGGIVEEEFRVEYVSDRTNTFGTAFLGLTMGCAKCHDHKYDPISQREYFETYSFFNNVDEAGQISWNDATPVPTLPIPTAEVEKITTFLRAQIADREKGLNETNSEAAFASWLKTAAAPAESTKPKGVVAHFPLDGSLTDKVGGARGEMRRMASSNEVAKFGKGLKGRALMTDGDAWLHTNTGVFGRADAFTIGINVNIPADLENGVIFHKGNGAALHNFRGYHLALKDNRLEIMLAHTAPYNAITEYATLPLPRNEWVHLTFTYDGSSRAAGLKLYINGVESPSEVRIDNLYKDILFREGEEQPLQIGARWRGKGIGKSAVDELTVFNRELTPLEAAHLAGKDDLRTAIAGRESSPQLRAYYNANFNHDYRQRLAALQKLRTESMEREEEIPEVMVMAEMKEARQAYILERGDYSVHGEPVSAGVVKAVLEFPDDLPRNRLGLAQWLMRPDNPLFARVTVNRYWQHYFGQGLVKSAEDFGSQGDQPTHPELLDYLALTFRNSGWDVKALQKLIVLSGTYRQSSLADDHKREVDPANELLARGPSSRLSAEMLRDNALAAADLLVEKIGGPSVNPYQPDGLWRVNGTKYAQHHGDSLYRRSMYTIWKRTVPNPTQSTFDAPTRSECTVRRQKTSTPLQSLVLLNDPTFVEASRNIGEDIAKIEDPALAIGKAFKKMTGRAASDQELALLIDLRDREYQKFHSNAEKMTGWLEAGESRADARVDPALIAANSVVASTILNLDATIVKR